MEFSTYVINKTPDYLIGLDQGQPVLVPVDAASGGSSGANNTSAVVNRSLATYALLQAQAAAGALIPGSVYNVNGAPYFAVTASTFVSMNGQAGNPGEETLLVVGGSVEARTNNLQAVVPASVSVAKGVITFQVGVAVTIHAGDSIGIRSKPYPQIEAIYKVLTTDGTNITAKAMNVAVADTVAGSLSVNQIDMHMLQHWSAAAGWPALLSIALGGRVRILVNATGGTNTSDWLDPRRLAQIASYGHVHAIMLSTLGNSINAGGQSAAAALADLEALIQQVQPFCDIVYLCHVPAVTNENTSNPKVAANTAVFAAGARTNMALDELPKKYPYVKVIPLFAAEAQNYGAANTADVTNAYAPYQQKADDGIHNLRGECQVWATTMATIMAADFPWRASEMGFKPMSVIASPTADPGGKLVQNIFEGFFGNVPVTGGVPNSCTATTSNVGGWTITSTTVINPDGGSDWIASLVTNGNNAAAGTAISQLYTGTTNSLLTQLNTATSQGVDIECFIGGGVYGAPELGMGFTELVLEADYGDGQGIIPVASGLSTMGQFQAGSMQYSDTTKAGESWGYWGIIRFPRFQIPVGTTLVSARLRQTCKPKTGNDIGSLTQMRLSGSSLIKVFN